MWHLISLLPVDLLVSCVLTQLQGHELARLDEAWPKSHRQWLHEHCFSRLPPIGVPTSYQFEKSVYAWFWKRAIRVQVLHIQESDAFSLTDLQTSSALFDSIDLQCLNESVAKIALELLLDHNLGRKIKSLTGPHLLWTDEDGYEPQTLIWFMLGKFRNLETLCAYLADRSEGVLAVISSNPNLRSLTIHHEGFSSPGYYSSLLNNAVGVQLTKLSVTADELTNADLITISTHCRELRELYISVGDMSVGDGDDDLSEIGFLAIARSCTKLRSFAAELVRLKTSQLFQTLVEHCSQLQRIEGKFELTNSGLRAMSNCPHLTAIDVTWQVDDEQTVLLGSESLCRLRSLKLNIPQMTTAQWKALNAAAHYWSELHSFDCAGLVPKSDTLLSTLAARCSALQSLKLFFGDGFAPTKGFETHLRDLARRNSATLKELFLNGNRLNLLTTTQLMAVVNLLPALTNLCVSVPQIMFEDQQICQLAQHCPQLVEFFPAGFDVTDRAVRALADNCPKLSRLHIQRSTSVTEAALIYLVQRCRHLKDLHISTSFSSEAIARIRNAGKLLRCQPITDRAVCALAEHCPKLSDVQVDKCIQVTEPALTLLVQRCRGIKRLFVAAPISDSEIERIEGAGRAVRWKKLGFRVIRVDNY